jgi:hypothetical protein
VSRYLLDTNAAADARCRPVFPFPDWHEGDKIEAI